MSFGFSSSTILQSYALLRYLLSSYSKQDLFDCKVSEEHRCQYTTAN